MPAAQQCTPAMYRALLIQESICRPGRAISNLQDLPVAVSVTTSSQALIEGRWTALTRPLNWIGSQGYCRLESVGISRFLPRDPA